MLNFVHPKHSTTPVSIYPDKISFRGWLLQVTYVLIHKDTNIPICCHFFVMYKNVHFGKTFIFVHLNKCQYDFYVFLYRNHPSQQDVKFCTSWRNGFGSQNVHNMGYINVSYVVFYSVPVTKNSLYLWYKPRPTSLIAQCSTHNTTHLQLLPFLTPPPPSAAATTKNDVSQSGIRQQNQGWQGGPHAWIWGIGPGHSKPGVTPCWNGDNGGVTLPWVFWDKDVSQQPLKKQNLNLAIFFLLHSMYTTSSQNKKYSCKNNFYET